MFSTVLSATLRGLHVEFIHVEADTSDGLPMFHMVGYLSSEVKEAGDRVRTAIRNSDMSLPTKKIVVNLSPADVRKKGTAFDLPIAIAILVSLEMLPYDRLKNVLLVGELSLDGSVREVFGILPIVLEAKKQGCEVCIIPKVNQTEAELVDGIQVVGVESLHEVCCFLRGEKIGRDKKAERIQETFREAKESHLDYSDIKGQKLLKRATEVAVAGGHSIMMIGPPGAGKTMIAKRIPTILPPLTKEESMELTALYSIVGKLDKDNPLITTRPFREVHHTVTQTALVGGGVTPKPGEITLADKGILFLDEIAEFHKPVLEVLRQPLEEHRIRITRSRGDYEFPADFLLVAAMNPCPCGNYPDLNRCTCTTPQIQSYLGRISQPFLDRIDICVEAERVQYDDLQNEKRVESSKEIRERVIRARQLQKQRYEELHILTNAQLGVSELATYCALGSKQEQMMRQAFDKMEMTTRVYHKVLRVARTIADLDGSEEIELCHLREAIGYRTIDKKYWRR